jgi:two-component system, OmpR family, sensor histidine kinase KdpD
MQSGMRILAVFALIGVATGLGLVLNAGTAPASLLLLLAVVLSSLLGRVSGIVASVAGFLCLNFFFTAPERTFAVHKADDLFALAVFVGVALVVGTVVASATELRRAAERREQEVRMRLDVTERLRAGEDPEAVAEGAAAALLQLFELASCRLLAGAHEVEATGEGPPGEAMHLEAGSSTLDAVASKRRPLSNADKAVLAALVASLGAALEGTRLEAEARNARIAAAVGRTRSGFLSAVSHNLRTPLASIKAAVSTLLAPDARLDRDDERELLDTIYEETDRLERLVTKVLNLSRIRAGGLELDPQPADLAGLAQAAIRRLRPIARAHRVRLDVPHDLPEVLLDVTMMEQVFLNLLENSIRFSPPGSEIRVEARVRDGAVEVRVADHGPGIPEGERERVFEEFVRVDSRHESTGTGLGLAIVRAVVVAHDGRVWAEETPGGGATIAFSLPRP